MVPLRCALPLLIDLRPVLDPGVIGAAGRRQVLAPRGAGDAVLQAPAGHRLPVPAVLLAFDGAAHLDEVQGRVLAAGVAVAVAGVVRVTHAPPDPPHATVARRPRG